MLPSGPVFTGASMIVVPVLASPPVSPVPIVTSLSVPPGAIATSPSPPPLPRANYDISRNVMKTVSPPKFFKINDIAKPYGHKQATGIASSSEDVSVSTTKSDGTLKNSNARSTEKPLPTKNAKAPVDVAPTPPPK
ncbi:hypothetical protein GCK32_017047, partial [Trichostrongylus colubriformis]